MAILKYVPPTKKIIDKRSPDGGYYEAECEICGTKFYPERSNAKYCNPNCGLQAHRVAVANGTAMKRGGKVSASKPDIKDDINTESSGTGNFTGKDAVISWFENEGISVYGLKSKFNSSFEIGSRIEWETHFIERVSSVRYDIY